jgi:hypothetical protein
MKEALAVLSFGVFLVGAIALGWWLSVRNYRECRAHGFSAFYCWSQELGR